MGETDRTSAAPPLEGRLRFGDFELDLGTGELRRDGVFVPLQRQVARALVVLVSRRGRLVPREELIERLWGERHLRAYDPDTSSRQYREQFLLSGPDRGEHALEYLDYGGEWKRWGVFPVVRKRELYPGIAVSGTGGAPQPSDR